jgi:hypothetical protein
MDSYQSRIVDLSMSGAGYAHRVITPTFASPAKPLCKPAQLSPAEKTALDSLYAKVAHIMSLDILVRCIGQMTGEVKDPELDIDASIVDMYWLVQTQQDKMLLEAAYNKLSK